MLCAAVFQIDRLGTLLRGGALFLSESLDRLEQHEEVEKQLVREQLEFNDQEIEILRSAFKRFKQSSCIEGAVGHALRFGKL